MIRQPEREQLNRLTAKTLDQVFAMRVKEGMGCSQFEAQALTELVKEVYFPWLAQPEAIQAGQLAMTAVSADEPGHKPLAQCQMVPMVLTLYAGEEDHTYRLSQKGAQGTVALRRRQIVRMAQEALDQGALLTAEDFAFRIFNCGLRTMVLPRAILCFCPPLASAGNRSSSSSMWSIRAILATLSRISDSLYSPLTARRG